MALFGSGCLDDLRQPVWEFQSTIFPDERLTSWPDGDG